MTEPIRCFKTYDVRGKVPEDLGPGVAYRIGRAFAGELGPREVAVGRDVRPSGPELVGGLAAGLADGGARVRYLGVCGTEEVYFAVFHLGLDGGVMVTASHNPRAYNGLKLVGGGARPLDERTLAAIRERAQGLSAPPDPRADPEPVPVRSAYVAHLLGLVDRRRVPALRVVIDPGNGGAGPVAAELGRHLPLELIPVRAAPDGTFPNGVPNPLLPENREVTAKAVRDHGADLGVAWDGDFDRCFLFDRWGRFVEGYYLVGLLAQAMLDRHPGEAVVYEPRLTWSTRETVEAAGGRAVLSRTGHTFMKAALREAGAVYGGEISGHHFFRDFGCCDSGMLPWLLIAESMGAAGKALDELVDPFRAAHPCSDELNFEVADPEAVMEAMASEYASEGATVERAEGITVELAEWRCNLRRSNTESLLRLNVETRADPGLLERKVTELTRRIRSASG